MRWRSRGWPERVPRPVAAKLSSEALERLRTQAADFVMASTVLRELLDNVQLARGRLYFWREAEDLMARITPLSSRSMLLEAPRRQSWTEVVRGPLVKVLKALEADEYGTFHGLGALAQSGPPDEDGDSAPVVLHRDYKVPIPVAAEPRDWYAMHRMPVIVEVSPKRDRVLVRFVAHGMNGSFHGTCLYARRAGEWGCYAIRPNASETIADAVAWLDKRGWQGWG